MENNFLNLFFMKILYTFVKYNILKIFSIFSIISHNTLRKKKNIKTPQIYYKKKPIFITIFQKIAFSKKNKIPNVFLGPKSIIFIHKLPIIHYSMKQL